MRLTRQHDGIPHIDDNDDDDHDDDEHYKPGKAT